MVFKSFPPFRFFFWGMVHPNRQGTYHLRVLHDTGALQLGLKMGLKLGSKQGLSLKVTMGLNLK